MAKLFNASAVPSASSGLSPGGVVRVSCKKFFFDRETVKRYIGAKNAAALNRIGGKIRKIARWSMPYRKKPSVSPNPPHSHTGLLRGKNRQGGIQYSYDPKSNSCVVGPVKLNKVYFNRAGEPITGPVPNVLEFGGDIWVLEVWKGIARDAGGRFSPYSISTSSKGQWVRADLRKKSKLWKRRKRLTRTHIKPRPYMYPAMIKALPDIPSAWSSSVRAA